MATLEPEYWTKNADEVPIPSEIEPLPGRSDRTPGAISFFDPRPQANMTAIRHDPQVDPEHRVQPAPGMILMWPAFLHHLVHSNLSQTPRISISFNIVLKQSSAHLPRQ